MFVAKNSLDKHQMVQPENGNIFYNPFVFDACTLLFTYSPRAFEFRAALLLLAFLISLQFFAFSLVSVCHENGFICSTIVEQNRGLWFWFWPLRAQPSHTSNATSKGLIVHFQMKSWCMQSSSFEICIRLKTVEPEKGDILAEHKLR